MSNYTTERPGVYVKFRGVSKASIAENGRGIVALPLALNYGPANAFTEVTRDSGTAPLLGYSLGEALFPLIEEKETQLFFVAEALKKAHTVLVYRLGGGLAATATGGGLTATALHEGSRGNDFAFQVTAVNSQFLVETFVDGKSVHRQTVFAAKDIKSNSYVTFSGQILAVCPLTYLSGGENEEVTNADYDGFFAAAAKKQYNTTCYVGTELEVQEAFVRFVKSEREQEGKFVSCLLQGLAADYEGVISVDNGVVLNGGFQLPAHYATAYVAGATAAATDVESLTYARYPGAIDVLPLRTSSETVEALRKGLLVFTGMQGEVVIERDINSLLTYTAEKPAVFSKNRVVRVLDTIATDVKAMCKRLVIGKLANNPDGRGILKSSIVSYLQEKGQKGALAAFDPVTDVLVSEGDSSDTIFVEIAVRPVDAVEKILMTLSIE